MDRYTGKPDAVLLSHRDRRRDKERAEGVIREYTCGIVSDTGNLTKPCICWRDIHNIATPSEDFGVQSLAVRVFAS